MPFFAQQSREQLRQTYVDAWRKRCEMLPMTPLETQIADVIALHPEYHGILLPAAEVLGKDWLPEGGATNPFLHMGLHLAVREQVATDRPAGIRAAYQSLLVRVNTAHDTEHRIMDCLAEALWSAQRHGLPPNEQAYLDKIRQLTLR